MPVISSWIIGKASEREVGPSVIAA